jgi:hypothetical protein
MGKKTSQYKDVPHRESMIRNPPHEAFVVQNVGMRMVALCFARDVLARSGAGTGEVTIREYRSWRLTRARGKGVSLRNVGAIKRRL